MAGRGSHLCTCRKAAPGIPASARTDLTKLTVKLCAFEVATLLRPCTSSTQVCQGRHDTCVLPTVQLPGISASAVTDPSGLLSSGLRRHAGGRFRASLHQQQQCCQGCLEQISASQCATSRHPCASSIRLPYHPCAIQRASVQGSLRLQEQYVQTILSELRAAEGASGCPCIPAVRDLVGLSDGFCASHRIVLRRPCTGCERSVRAELYTCASQCLCTVPGCFALASTDLSGLFYHVASPCQCSMYFPARNNPDIASGRSACSLMGM